jgi:hypothetical protein
MVMDEETAKKMDYIAAYYGRSRIKEITWACKEYIKDFEAKNGEIEQVGE